MYQIHRKCILPVATSATMRVSGVEDDPEYVMSIMQAYGSEDHPRYIVSTTHISGMEDDPGYAHQTVKRTRQND